MVEVRIGKLKDLNKSMPEGIIPPANRQPLSLAYFTGVQPISVVTVDLTPARLTPTALGSLTLPDGTVVSNWVANTLVITTFPGGAALSIGPGDQFTATPNSSGMITGSLGLRIEGIPFTQLYLQNPSQPGVGVEILLAWVD